MEKPSGQSPADSQEDLDKIEDISPCYATQARQGVAELGSAHANPAQPASSGLETRLSTSRSRVSETPGLSVIIPVKDGAELLRGCLESLWAMDFPRECLEILVVDNGSTDASAEVARAHGARVIREDRPGPYAARNAGVGAARETIIAFTDADCRVDKGWARAIQAAMKKFDAVCGLSLGSEGGAVARLIQERYEKNLVGRARATPRMPVFDTRNAATTRAAFLAAGGFDSRLEDIADDLYGIALARRGTRVGFFPSMVVYHIHPESLSDVLRRQKRHGRFIPLVRQLYGPEMAEYFPGILKYGFVDRKGIAGKAPSALLLLGAAVAATFLRLKLLIFMHVGLAGIRTLLFDWFCRFGTVWGISEIGLSGVAHHVATLGERLPLE